MTADDDVLFSSNSSISEARNSLLSSLNSVADFLKFRGLVLSPLKSKSICWVIGILPTDVAAIKGGSERLSLR